MTKYWIKLYHETLHDPKMGLLSDRLYRRTIELFLIAGEQDDNGYLPPIEEIAWTLRHDAEQLETEMIELQRKGILSVVDSRWLVTNFAKRQEPMDKAEYMRRKREEEQREQYQGEPVTEPVTSGNTDIDIDTDTDKNRIEEEERISRDFDIIQAWLEELAGLLATSGDIPALQELAELGIARCDIRGALQWRKDNSVKPAKRIGQLKDGIITNRNMRIQNGSARAAPNKPRRKNAGTLAAARAALEAENDE